MISYTQYALCAVRMEGEKKFYKRNCRLERIKERKKMLMIYVNFDIKMLDERWKIYCIEDFHLSHHLQEKLIKKYFKAERTCQEVFI